MAQRPKLYAALIALVLSGGAAFAQTTPEVFTYQGQLRDAGTLPTGLYDFEFRLYDDAIAGSPVGTPTVIFADDVPVNSGLFNVPLDFGPGTFDGTTRFLEIAVRDGASAGPFTTLNPRVAITPTPYSIYALNAGNATTATLALSALTADSVDWTSITNIPPDIADGDDVGSVTYSAGTGLTLTLTTFSVNFLPPGPLSGISTNAARADHRHDGSDITTGTVGDAFIAATIARDIEVTNAVNTHAALTGNGAHIPATGITDANVAVGANIAWSKINVPADIADGDDNTTYSAGTGLDLTGTTFSVLFGGPGVATTASRSDHTHSGADITSGTVGEAFIDAAIARDTEVTAAVSAHAAVTGNGAHIPATGITDANVAAGANIAWSKINVPPDIADGDDNTTYSAGTGLDLTGTTFSVLFGGPGVATTASRSDHTHSGADITSGTVGEAFIDAAIARDTEVTAAVSAHAAITGLGAHIPATGINSALVEDDTLTDQDLAPNSVTASELADNAVDNAAMQDDAVGSAEVIDNSLTSVDIANRTRSIFIPSYAFFARENGQNGTPNFAGVMGGDQRVTLQELRDGLDTTLTTQFQIPRDLASTTAGAISFRVHLQHLNGGANTRVNMGFFFERVAGPAIANTADPINFQYVIFNGAPAVTGDDRDPGPAIPASDSYLAIDIPVDPGDTWASDEATPIAPGDIFYLNIRRNGGAVTDTHSSSVYLIGVEVIYIADM